MKIPLELIPIAYDISKKVFERKLTVTEGTKKLAFNNRMNVGSARDYIYDFRYLMQGKKFSRTLNVSSMEYFMGNILKDYGHFQLSNALTSLLKHIEYFESKRKCHLHEMRAIHSNYLSKINFPDLVTDETQVLQNIRTIEDCLTEGTEDERQRVAKLIRDGICFVAYQVDGEIRFAPSRFLGYVNNSLTAHSINDTKSGGETNRAINTILKSKPLKNTLLKEKYYEYCNGLGITPGNEGAFGNERKFWKWNLPVDFSSNKELTGEFPEGKMVERSHKFRERNSQVVRLAKSNFKMKYGKLFCEICQFDFEKTYGYDGRDFIEGHHTIAVSEMPPEYKTKPEEIALLCSNCHRMIHKKRPWLTMKDLKKLLNKKINAQEN